MKQSAPRRGRRPRWTYNDLVLLANLSAEGFSASQIAHKLNATRNAVSSVMYRRGLFARPRGKRNEKGID